MPIQLINYINPPIRAQFSDILYIDQEQVFLIHSYADIWNINRVGGSGLNDSYSTTLISRGWPFNQDDVNIIKQYISSTSTGCTVPTSWGISYLLSGNCYANTVLQIQYQSTQIIFKSTFIIYFYIDAILDSSSKINVDINSQPFQSQGYSSILSQNYSYDGFQQTVKVNSNLLTIHVTPTNLPNNISSAYISTIFLAVQLCQTNCAICDDNQIINSKNIYQNTYLAESEYKNHKKQILFYNYKVLIHSYAIIWDINKDGGSGLNDSYTTTLISSQGDFNQADVDNIQKYLTSTECKVPTSLFWQTNDYLLSGNCNGNTILTISYYPQI
ncbi:hypothetical protein ABPG73_008394 [Tetrahymena malaccensis]